MDVSGCATSLEAGMVGGGIPKVQWRVETGDDDSVNFEFIGKNAAWKTPNCQFANMYNGNSRL